MTDANTILMGGGSAAPPWKFEEPGTTHTGTIASPPTARQEREYDPHNPGGGNLKFFPSGDPIMGVITEVQTSERDPADPEDNGRRTFYIEGRYIKEAVRNAVRDAGAQGLDVGGRLTVTFTHREDPPDKRSRKYWQVTYTPPGNAALMQDDKLATGPSDPRSSEPPQTTPSMTPEQLRQFQAWQRSQQTPPPF